MLLDCSETKIKEVTAAGYCTEALKRQTQKQKQNKAQCLPDIAPSLCLIQKNIIPTQISLTFLYGWNIAHIDFSKRICITLDIVYIILCKQFEQFAQRENSSVSIPALLAFLIKSAGTGLHTTTNDMLFCTSPKEFNCTKNLETRRLLKYLRLRRSPYSQ